MNENNKSKTLKQTSSLSMILWSSNFMVCSSLYTISLLTSLGREPVAPCSSFCFCAIKFKFLNRNKCYSVAKLKKKNGLNSHRKIIKNKKKLTCSSLLDCLHSRKTPWFGVRVVCCLCPLCVLISVPFQQIVLKN